MMEKKYLIAMFSVVLVSFVFGIFGLAMLSSSMTATTVSDTGLQYHSNVCIYKNAYNSETDSYDGSQLIQCKHNTLTNAGKNVIMSALGSSTTYGPMIYIMLCNASIGNNACTGSVSNTTMSYLLNITSGCGLNVTQGTYTTQGVGNWTVWNTFTNGCGPININQTGLANGTDNTYTYFAYNNFAQTTLQTNDQLTVNWTVWVT